MEHSENPFSIPTYVPNRIPSRTQSVITSTLPNSSPTNDPSRTHCNNPSNVSSTVPWVEHSDYPRSEPSYVPGGSQSSSNFHSSVEEHLHYALCLCS